MRSECGLKQVKAERAGATVALTDVHVHFPPSSHTEALAAAEQSRQRQVQCASTGVPAMLSTPHVQRSKRRGRS